MSFFIWFALWALANMCSRDHFAVCLVPGSEVSCLFPAAQSAHHTDAVNFNLVGQCEKDEFQFLNDVKFLFVL